MKHNSLFAVVAAAGLGFFAGALTLVPAKAVSIDPPPAEVEIDLPPGWTMEDIVAYVNAGTPGPMHAHLREGVGTWDARVTMWKAPDSEPIVSSGRVNTTAIMGGRFTQVDMLGEMPGMGPYRGMGIYGYNNVSQQFEAIWIDDHSTNMMRGTGQLARDGKTLTWDFAYMCPIRMAPTVMREIERVEDQDTRSLEMHGADPKTGVEYKMMVIEFTRAE